MPKGLKLHVLDLGRMRMDRSLMLADWQLASAADPSPPRAMVEFPVSAYLIDTPEGRILFDAGCNPENMGPGGRWPAAFQTKFPWSGGEECYLPNRLEQLGLGVADIRHVVLSHMHNDHCGCVEYFRKSKIFVHRDEFSAALHAFARHDHTGPYIWQDTKHWIDAQLDWRLVEPWEHEIALCEGVRILNWGSGHAHGMLGLHVDLREQPGVILTSDAVYCRENFGPPARPSGVVYDSIGAARTVEIIRSLAERSRSQVWFGHDLEQFNGLIHSTAGYYE